MNFGINIEQTSRILEVLSLHPAVEQVIIFGSRAKGTFREGSDVDLAVVGKELKLTDLLQIGSELELLSYPFIFDLVLFYGIKDKELIDHINRVGKVFYQKDSNGS
jgi:uncharacterized protein